MPAYRPDKENQNGLTLIEVLIAMTILVLAISGLYTSFSQGLQIYRRSEEGLDRGQEVRMFLTFLRRDLGNMVRYEPVPFNGKSGEIEFAAHLRKFTARGYSDGLYRVRYKIHSDRIEREEESLREKAGGGKEKREMVVLDNIRKGEFAFPYKDDETMGVLWRDIWDAEDGLGTPRGMRLKMQLLTSMERKATYVLGSADLPVKSAPVFLDEFYFIPQGAWGSLE
ncbi:MAG: prepilin-type N-terminal cleavage/methylation domain-containing protein [Candidatus Omnitrophica bacterium]|nr:prepilin-type N-terminal cleavage/methylation domain-containing protein [Candidatus Omnitrophota bacterium]